MRPNQSLLITALTILLSTAVVMAYDDAENLGQVQFPVSCSSEAQTPFNRAVALLHSFWYADAVKGFTTVTEADPT